MSTLRTDYLQDLADTVLVPVTSILNSIDLSDEVDVSKGAALIARGSQVVASIADLRALLKTSASKDAFVKGYAVPGDGGGGSYYLDEVDVVSVDNGGTIIVATDGGRWKLSYTTSISVKQFGAVGDGSADDTVAIQAALNASSSVYVPIGDYKISAELTLNSDQHFFGEGRKSRIFTTTGSMDNGINMLMAFEKFNITIESLAVQNTGFGNAFPIAGTFTGMGIPIGLIGCTSSAVRKCYVFDGGGVTANPGVNQGSCGIYLSNSNNCRVLDNFVQSGQNGITLDQWYSTLAGGSKASFKLGHNLISDNTISNMAGRGIALDDDLAQDGFNSFTNNSISLCAFASISATSANAAVFLNNICDGKYTVARTQSTTSAPCYYGIKTTGLQNGKIEGNTFINDLVSGIFSFNPQNMSFSNNHITPDCTNADPEAMGALGAVCIVATDSNSLSGNRVDGNYIKRLGSVGTIPGILVQTGAVTANHHDMSISGNQIFKFNGNSISVPTVSTVKSSRFKVNNNVLNGADTSSGATGVYANGLVNSEFADNLIYSFVTGAVDANGQFNQWTGKIDFCGQGFVHSSMNTNYLAIHFTNITNEAIFGSSATSGTTDATNCKFNSVGFIKSGVSAAAATGILVEVYVAAAAAPTPSPGEIAIAGVGDRILNSTPTVAQPKARVCTVAGSPGTWVSEGVL